MILDLRLLFKFKAAIRYMLKDRPDELRFVLNHERLGIVTQNLSAQIVKYEKAFGDRGNQKTIDKMIIEVAKMFVVGALKNWADKNMSEAKRLGIERARNEKQEGMEQIKEVVKEVRDEVQTWKGPTETNTH